MKTQNNVYRFWKSDWTKSVTVKWNGDKRDLRGIDKMKIMNTLGVKKWSAVIWELSTSTNFALTIN